MNEITPDFTLDTLPMKVRALTMTMLCDVAYVLVLGIGFKLWLQERIKDFGNNCRICLLRKSAYFVFSKWHSIILSFLAKTMQPQHMDRTGLKLHCSSERCLYLLLLQLKLCIYFNLAKLLTDTAN